MAHDETAHEHARPAPARPAGPQGRTEPLVDLHRAAGNAAVGAAVRAVVSGGGTPLDPAVQRTMERALGTDLSSVRVHTDAAAARSAAAVSARAYTSGDHVVFGAGAYDPGSPAGLHTLAHELAHVGQQRRGAVAGTDTGNGLRVSDPGDADERAADRVAHEAVASLGVSRRGGR
ncbi:MAG TPA: DUF4157 domain-containing protein [Frankiaceae bacterium]|nr:DUF4157 domain-containing protein [Frankiaceae bacterium]